MSRDTFYHLKKVVQPHNPLDWSAADTGNHNPYFHEGRIN